MGQLGDHQDVVHGPKPVGHVVERIQIEETVLHGHIIGVPQFEVYQQARHHRRPHHPHNEVHRVQSGIKTAPLSELRHRLKEVDARRQVKQDDGLIAQCELCVLDEVLMSVAAPNTDEISSPHRWRRYLSC